MEKLDQAKKDGVVIGLHEIAGFVPRLDIDLLLLREPDTFNLFLPAFQKLKDEAHTEKMGYFQIAGISQVLNALWPQFLT